MKFMFLAYGKVDVVYDLPKNLICDPSITDGVHRNENVVEIIPVFSTFSNFFKKKKKNYKSHFM